MRSIVLFCLFFLFLLGCITQSCERTTDCPPTQICQGGYCITPSCRLENETCDMNLDCCNEMLCENMRCVVRECPDCDDGDNCTEDICNFNTSFQCIHQTVTPCCGNNICEVGEDCENCMQDCSCNESQVCVGGVCTNLLTAIEKNYPINACREGLFNAWQMTDYAGVKNKSTECSEMLSNFISDLDDLEERGELGENQTTLVKIRILELKSMREEVYFIKNLAEIGEDETEENETIQYLNGLRDALSHLRYAMYDLYLLKQSYPGYWSDDHDELFDEYSERYEGINQNINALYDEMGSYDYKYAFQVDPNDPIVIDLVENLTNGIDDEYEISYALFEYVLTNISYTYDPDWKTDWVQPPAFTIMKGSGDCDDHTVLLASLFYRAGVGNTLLCNVGEDHITVGVEDWEGDYIIYETAWKEDVDEPLYEWNYPGEIDYCYSPQKLELVYRCDDGTLYGECSIDKPRFCDDGAWILDCMKCGCPSNYPHCAEVGEDQGDCFSCPKGWEWDIEHSVCCPKGYYYNPNTDDCRWG